MFPLLVAVVVAADEVLGMVERGEPMGTGDKAIPTVSPTAGSGAGSGVGCTHGWQLSQTAEEYRSSSSPHSSPPETSLLDLPKTIPPPSRTHLLGHAWFYTDLLLSW